MKDLETLTGSLTGLALLVGAAFAVVLVVAAFLRWMLRINHICKRLDQLAAERGYLDAAKDLHVNSRARVDPKDVRIPVN